MLYLAKSVILFDYFILKELSYIIHVCSGK